MEVSQLSPDPTVQPVAGQSRRSDWRLPVLVMVSVAAIVWCRLNLPDMSARMAKRRRHHRGSVASADVLRFALRPRHLRRCWQSSRMASAGLPWSVWCGRRCGMVPALWRNAEGYSPRSDVWSVFVPLFAMAFGFVLGVIVGVIGVVIGQLGSRAVDRIRRSR